MPQSLSSIQFLRFVAALAVCVHHAHTAVTVHGLMRPASDIVTRMTDVGAAGVHIFFVISGFIMVYTAFGRPSPDRPTTFFLKRALRIFPIYWVVCVLYLVAGSAGFIAFDFGLGGLLASLLLLPGSSSLIVGPGWTLTYELYFYLCFGAVIVFGRSRSLVILSLFFAISIILGSVLNPAHAGLKVMTSHLLVEFIVGGAIGILYLSSHTITKPLAQALILAAIGGFAASVSAIDAIPSALAWGGPSALLIIGLVMAEKSGSLPAWIGKAAWLGNSSYLLYLIHTLVFDVALKFLRTGGASAEYGWSMIGLVVAMSVLIAIVMHDHIESPLNAFLARIILKRGEVSERGVGISCGQVRGMGRTGTSYGDLPSVAGATTPVPLWTAQAPLTGIKAKVNNKCEN
ncbi:MAG: acyltransferase [Burkholderiales bacterium]|nr:acyltransferase [Burkholderiales bacterium]